MMVSGKCIPLLPLSKNSSISYLKKVAYRVRSVNLAMAQRASLKGAFGYGNSECRGALLKVDCV